MSYIEKDETPEQIHSGEAKKYIGFQEVTCHLIFDVKVEFKRKAYMVSNGEMTEAPLSLDYSSIVSRGSVSLDFFIAELNVLYIMVGDVRN